MAMLLCPARTAPARPAAGTHLVAGSSSVDTAVALVLAESGAEVVLCSRGGGNSALHENVRRVKVDASSLDSLLAAAPIAAVIYNCVNPPYHKWVTDWLVS
ncbi:hypothetical protein T492DRAFT_1101888 [Pavlovales sp. CCMP2436]|nr:hypothetical protein T492DRAFT_1101888 [Pavlovales sp. CCMP2436]